MNKIALKTQKKNAFRLKMLLKDWMFTLVKLGALCCFSHPVSAQAELWADSNHVETGNPFVLHLRLPLGLGKPDSLRLEAWSHILPVQNITSQTKWQREGAFLSKNLTVLFFDEDSIQIPSLPIVLLNGDTALSNLLEINVTATPSPDDLNDMAAIKDIHREPTLWTDYLPWLLGVLGVLAILGLLLWLVKRKAEAKIQSRNVQIPPHELALKKLEVLVQKNRITSGFFKEHYAELTFILREYLEKRFGIPARESTTEETLGHLKYQDFPAQLSGKLKDLLEQADLAKFAQWIPEASFHAESLEIARQIILETSQETDPKSPNPPPKNHPFPISTIQ
jgi:hypothetical protein